MLDPDKHMSDSGKRWSDRLSAKSAGVLVAGLLVVALAVGVFSGGFLRELESVASNAKSVATQIVDVVGTLTRSASPAENTTASAVRLGTYPRIVPTSGSQITVPTQTFMFNGAKYSVTPNVDGAIYWGAKKAERSMSLLSGETHVQWVDAYYRFFATDPEGQPVIDSACEQLRAISAKAGLSSDQYLELIAKYVQSIPYDNAKADAGGSAPLFPVETIVEGKGVCSDKSVLLAALLAHEGYAVALLDFATEKHMAVGVKGPGVAYGALGYLFLETTSPAYVTDVPGEYSGGMRLISQPQTIPIGTGQITYGGAADVARIVKARTTARSAAEALFASASKERLTAAQAAQINAQLQNAYNAELYLQSDVVDQVGNPVSQFMDRTQAIQWLNQMGWWN
ncbi:MAG: hypothetical protein HGA39_08545 [Coriobacteriia bacterium]|nr:hypothetical protein [Coriobacteriia bacterium]